MAVVHGPERYEGQGLSPDQAESGDRAIAALLADRSVRDHVDLVITYRDGAYEVWAARGMVRFRRMLEGDRLTFEVLEVLGENPIERQDPGALSTCAAELAAAHASGHPTDDPNTAYIEPAHVSYPWAYERIAQLFDSPHAPDLIVSPKAFCFGLQPGQHGALDCVQSRAPLAFAGPGIQPGRHDIAARHVDISPTIAQLMGLPKVDGKDASGRRAGERGVAPDVFLERQDGRVLTELIASDGAQVPTRAYLILFDGLSHSELMYLIESGDEAVRNLRRILDRAALLAHGSTVNFPSITWPSHSTILTGAWCGHHDIVNPAYYVRSTRESLTPQGQALLTEGFLGSQVETLYEAFHRAFGPEAVTASIHEPQGRGATHAPLENRVLPSKARLKVLTPELMAEIDPRHARDGKDNVHREAQLDARGVAQVLALFEADGHPAPIFVAHEFAMTDGAGHDYGPHGEGLRAAVAESDRRLGRILDMLEAKGCFDDTLFVFTSDHGMAPQDVTLRANPVRHLERIGMQVVTHEPMIWLRDLAVEVLPAGDRRTVRVEVYENDLDRHGERVPVADAEVMLVALADGFRSDESQRTNAAGVVGLTIPADVPLEHIAVSVRHETFNSRHLRLDGTRLGIDLRQVLYGSEMERPPSPSGAA